MKVVYLSLGSNLGNREQNLQDALQFLEAEGIQLLKRSSLYETEPQDVRNQPWFLNLVAEAQTKIYPIQLLRRVQKIERDMGRQRNTPKGPRLIDIDILLYGRIVMETPGLIIPHPRLAERRFVLAPLAELVPDLQHPVNSRRIKDLLDRLEGQVVRQLAPQEKKEPDAGRASG